MDPMDRAEFKTQYVSGTANEKTCGQCLYHRL